MSAWISVKERLPERHQSVLVAIPPRRCSYLAVWRGYWKVYGEDGPVSVTHWQPLPEPPEES